MYGAEIAKQRTAKFPILSITEIQKIHVPEFLHFIVKTDLNPILHGKRFCPSSRFFHDDSLQKNDIYFKST